MSPLARPFSLLLVLALAACTDDAPSVGEPDATLAVDAGGEDAGAADATAAPDAAAPDAGPGVPELLPALTPTISTSVGSMQRARSGHTATLLPDGRVVVIGGENIRRTRQMLDSVELYDPATRSWSAAAPLPEPRANHTATLLDDGTILVVGGGASNAIGVPSGQEVRLDALLYDPATGASESLGPTRTPRHGHHAVRLPSGRVLLVGGADATSVDLPAPGAGGTQPFGRELASAELYDPATRTFSDTGSMREPRVSFTAVRLEDGRVIVSGGSNSENGPDGQSLATSELYDEATGLFTGTGDFDGRDRLFHAACRLLDGRVLVFGGKQANVDFLADVQLWSPASSTFERWGSARPGRTAPSVVPLADGGALFVGGLTCGNGGCGSLNTTTLWRPDGTTVEGPSLRRARALASATVLLDGRVLVAGGSDGVSLTSAELLGP